MRKISLNEKLVVYFVMIGVLGILVVAVFSYYNSRQALLSRTFDQLTSVRVNKKKQVEAFFQHRLRDVEMMAANAEITNLAHEIRNNPEFLNTLPDYLQGSNQYLFSYLKKSGYFNRLIIANQSGACLLVPLPDVHFLTYHDSNNGMGIIPHEVAMQLFHQGPLIHDVVVLSDSMQPAVFVSAPISGFQGKSVLVLEVSLSVINRIMLENDHKDGLGESGESYIVGADTMMVSQSRFRLHRGEKIKVNTSGYQEAAKGRTGTAVIDDYRGISVLSSFAPLDIPRLNWVILAEIDVDEAMSPVNFLLSKLLLIGLLNLILIFVFAFVFSRRITSPIIRLNNAARNIGSGSLDENLPIRSNDEIGELTATFNEMVLQLKQQKDALADERKMRLRSMIDGQEKERQRLSRDLHDGLGQSLIAIKLQLESFCDGLNKGQNEQMRKIKQYFELTIEDIRRMSNDLAPSVLDEFGLSTALRNLCRSFSSQSGIDISFESTGNIPTLAKQTRIYFYRICQEGLTNAIKHARANQIEVSLSFEENQIALLIKDNGTGFDLEKARRCHGNGLNNIYERAQLLRGFVHIDTAPEKGALLRIECNLKS